MSMKMFVVCGDVEEAISLAGEGVKIPGILGSPKIKLKEEAVELKEVLVSTLESLDSIKEKIQEEAKLNIEISGSIKMGEDLGGDAKFFIFSLGAKKETQRIKNMKICLETTVKPKPKV